MVGSLKVLTATASMIMSSIRQGKSCKPVEIQCFSNCGGDSSEAAVGFLGVVVGSFSFELDCEL